MQAIISPSESVELIQSPQNKINQKPNKHSFRVKSPKFLALQRKAQKYSRKMQKMRQINQKYSQQIKAVEQKSKENKLPPIFQYRVPHSYEMIMQSYDNFFSSAQAKNKDKKKETKNKNRSFSYRLDAPKLLFEDQTALEKIILENLVFEKEGQEDRLFVCVLQKRANIVMCIKPMKIRTEQMLVIKSEHYIQIFGKIAIDGKDYLLVSQNFNQSLRKLIKEFGTLQLELISKFIRQLVDCLKPIHLRKCKHGNINMDSVYHNGQGNILIDTSDIKAYSKRSELRESTFDTEYGITENQSIIRQRISESRHVFEDDQTMGMFINYYYPPEFLIPQQIDKPNQIIQTQKCMSYSPFETGIKGRKDKNAEIQRQSKIDVWQIGVLCIELLFGTITKHNKMHPYNYMPVDSAYTVLSLHQQRLIQLINCRFQQIDQSFQTSRQEDQIQKQIPSPEFVQFIRKCLTVNPDLRPNIWQISKLDFINLTH